MLNKFILMLNKESNILVRVKYSFDFDSNIGLKEIQSILFSKYFYYIYRRYI